MKVAAVIPAYNEESRIGRILEILQLSDVINEIIVVSDGSTDKTYETAAAYEGVRAVNLKQNLGKGGAMAAGVKSTNADIVVFIDADLIGLTPSHVNSLVRPLLDDGADMTIGIFQQCRRSTDWAQKLTPYITGQRAIRREEFLAVPGLEAARFGVEIAITRHAQSKKLNVVRVPFSGVTHPLKEEKLGVLRGIAARSKMYWEIVKCFSRRP